MVQVVSIGIVTECIVLIPLYVQQMERVYHLTCVVAMQGFMEVIVNIGNATLYK